MSAYLHEGHLDYFLIDSSKQDLQKTCPHFDMPNVMISSEVQIVHSYSSPF